MSDEHKRYMDQLSQEYLRNRGYQADADGQAAGNPDGAKPASAGTRQARQPTTGQTAPGDAQTESNPSQKPHRAKNTTSHNGQADQVKPGLGTLIRHLLRRIFLGRH